MTTPRNLFPVAVGLQSCSIIRPQSLEGDVEIIIAPRAPRAFPLRSSPDLGIVLKYGLPHAVVSDGRRLIVPRDAIIFRPPWCVWSMEVADAAFVSIDIGPGQLPEDATYGPMAFREPAALPHVRSLARSMLQQSTSPLLATETIALLVEAAFATGFAGAVPQRDDDQQGPTVRRAKEFLAAPESYGCSLDDVARAANMNKFALLRHFKRIAGTTPHAFHLQVRLSAARTLLARGMRPSEVAMATGWADQSHFGRYFKRNVGLSPRGYARATRSVYAIA